MGEYKMKIIIFWSTIIIFYGISSVAFGWWLAEKHWSNPKEALEVGDFKVTASPYKDNPDQVWVEVFVKERTVEGFVKTKGVGLSFDKELFYVVSMAIGKPSNARLYVNKPVLIPNNTMHPPERYTKKNPQIALKTLLIEELKRRGTGEARKMYRASLVFCNDLNNSHSLDYLDPSLKKDMNLQIEEVTPAILSNDGKIKWVECDW